MLLNNTPLLKDLCRRKHILGTCKRLLTAPKSMPSNISQDLDILVKHGVLAKSDNAMYSFSCPLMGNVFMDFYVDSKLQRPYCNPQNPKDLVYSLVTRMDWKNLQKSKGVDKNKIIYEQGNNY